MPIGNYMAMVDRYKKSGGFVQLVQVIETCNAKKREQFMTIITEESPTWAEAINQKSLSFDRILSWKPEIILEVMASVNMLAFSAALKSLSPEALQIFLNKLSHQDKKKLEVAMAEGTSSPGEISSSILKVISETRNLLINNTIKADKIDQQLVIPDDYEANLEKGSSAASLVFDVPSALTGVAGGAVSSNVGSDIDKLQKKLILLSREVQTLKQENLVMKDKLDKIKKIA